MLDNRFLLEDDYQISYNDTIKAIGRLFDDTISELINGSVVEHDDGAYVDSAAQKDIENLKHLKEAFMDDFKMTFDAVSMLNKTNK